jgi:AcrR family transcriptional regulator
MRSKKMQDGTPQPEPAARPAGSGRARRKSPRGDASRKAILDSATRLFSAGGFNNVSIADIAADVGMTQAGMLHHFPSKADLLLAVLVQRQAHNSEAMRAERARGLDHLTTFLHTLRNNDRSPGMVQLMALLSAESIAVDHPAHDWFTQWYRQIVETAEAGVAELIDPAALPEGVTAETIASWLIALGDGLRIQWLLDPQSVNREVSIAHFMDLLRPYLIEPYRSFSWSELVRKGDR